MGALLSISLEQGLVFAVLAIGVFITYKILDFPDLSVEGTFPFGAFIFSKFMLLGLDPISSTLLSFIFGSLAGVLTYALHIKMKIAPILAGILTMTILYSVNLRVNGKANIPLYNYSSIFDYGNIILILIVIVLLIKFLMDMFLKTERGYLLIATGDNETLVKSLGVNCNTYKLLGLMLSNGIVAVSGALMGQLQGFADINMGASIIVSALASIIIGDTFLKNSKKLNGTTRAILGAISYKIIGGLALEIGLAPTDLKAISAIIVILFIGYNNLSILEFIKKEEKKMLQIKNLSKSFNIGTENETTIFENFNFTVKDSEFVAVLGSNGCGKSTLFNLISGSLENDGGSILLDGIDISNLKEEKRAFGISKIHQDPSKGVSPSLTILENISLASKKCEKFSLKRLIQKNKISDFITLLKEVDLGLENKLDTQVKFLSGGQRQALSLIMATLKKPKLLLLDEHTSALDPKTSKVIMEKTKQLINKQRITALMVSHNLRDAIKYADRIVMLDKGKIILDIPSKNITEEELSKIYTQKMNNSPISIAI